MWAPEQRSTHQSALERAERAPESVEPVRAPPPNPFSQPLALSKRGRAHPLVIVGFTLTVGAASEQIEGSGAYRRSRLCRTHLPAPATSTPRPRPWVVARRNQPPNASPNYHHDASTKKTGPAEAKQATTQRPVRTSDLEER